MLPSPGAWPAAPAPLPCSGLRLPSKAPLLHPQISPGLRLELGGPTVPGWEGVQSEAPIRAARWWQGPPGAGDLLCRAWGYEGPTSSEIQATFPPSFPHLLSN